jgi:hypothetical protein
MNFNLHDRALNVGKGGRRDAVDARVAIEIRGPPTGKHHVLGVVSTTNDGASCSGTIIIDLYPCRSDGGRGARARLIPIPQQTRERQGLRKGDVIRYPEERPGRSVPLQAI